MLAGCRLWVSHLNCFCVVQIHAGMAHNFAWLVMICRHQLETSVLSSRLFSEWLAAPCFNKHEHQHEPFLHLTKRTHFSTWINEHAIHWAVIALCFKCEKKKIIAAVLDSAIIQQNRFLEQSKMAKQSPSVTPQKQGPGIESWHWSLLFLACTLSLCSLKLTSKPKVILEIFLPWCLTKVLNLEVQIHPWHCSWLATALRRNFSLGFIQFNFTLNPSDLQKNRGSVVVTVWCAALKANNIKMIHSKV